MDESKGKKTTDVEEIRKWAEDRGGKPALVRQTETENSGLLRIDFAEANESLDEISWDEFSRIFEEHKLAFLYQEESKDGGKSRFNKFVRRSS